MGLKIRGRVIAVTALFGVLIWFMDGILDYFLFIEGSLLGLTFTNIPSHELYIRLFWFGGLLIVGIFSSWIITEREKALDDKEELESLLRAVRNVNQLLVRTDDKAKLIEGTCNRLMEARGYEYVWIVLLDESNKVITAAQAGLERKFTQLLEHLESGKLSSWFENTLNNSKITVTKNPSTTCHDCPLSHKYKENGGIHISLGYDGKVYGLLSASVPNSILDDTEEKELFKEVADDIGFALYQKEVEKDLRESEEKFRSYVENAPVGDYVIDQDGKYLEVNEAACEITGYSEEELLAMGISDLHPPEAMERVQEAFSKLLNEGKMEVELPYLRKNGT